MERLVLLHEIVLAGSRTCSSEKSMIASPIPSVAALVELGCIDIVVSTMRDHLSVLEIQLLCYAIVNELIEGCNDTCRLDLISPLISSLRINKYSKQAVAGTLGLFFRLMSETVNATTIVEKVFGVGGCPLIVESVAQHLHDADITFVGCKVLKSLCIKELSLFMFSYYDVDAERVSVVDSCSFRLVDAGAVQVALRAVQLHNQQFVSNICTEAFHLLALLLQDRKKCKLNIFEMSTEEGAVPDNSIASWTQLSFYDALLTSLKLHSSKVDVEAHCACLSALMQAKLLSDVENPELLKGVSAILTIIKLHLTDERVLCAAITAVDFLVSALTEPCRWMYLNETVLKLVANCKLSGHVVSKALYLLLVLAADAENSKQFGSMLGCEIIVTLVLVDRIDDVDAVDFTCGVINNFAHKNRANSSKLGELGVMDLLCKVLQLHHNVLSICLWVCCAVNNLVYDNPTNIIKFGEAGGCELIVEVLKL